MRNRSAFTMIELIFVIVVMGIIGKFGVEFLAQAYKSFIFTKINHELQQNSESAVELIASRLQYRIKDSTIARKSSGDFTGIEYSKGIDYTILEWVASDIDGFRGTTTPNWSGIIDLDASSKTNLDSPGTDTAEINNTIAILSNGDSNISDAALYFIGSNNDIVNGYGWDGNQLNNQNGTMHPITSVPSNVEQFTSSTGTDFAGVDIYEYYKLAWTANAVVLKDGNLTLYYDYQPWEGESYTAGKSATIMENVSTFQFMAIGPIIKIQVCVKSDLLKEETYSLCKEKTVF